MEAATKPPVQVTPVQVMSPREQINEHHPIIAMNKNDRNTLSVVNTHIHNNTLSQLTIDTSNQTENAAPESEEHMYLKKRAPSHDLQPHGKTWDAATEAAVKHSGLAANITQAIASESSSGLSRQSSGTGSMPSSSLNLLIWM